MKRTDQKTIQRWKPLIHAGVPLMEEQLEESMLHPDWATLGQLVHELIAEEVDPRDRVALAAWLIAMRDHYGSIYKKYFDCPEVALFLNQFPMDGKIIKLRRIAFAKISKVA